MFSSGLLVEVVWVVFPLTPDPSPPAGSLYHTIRSVFSAGPSTSRPHAGASDSLASMFSLDGGLPPSNHVSDHAGRACGVLLQTSSGLR
jgi:hypothetical protein